MKNIHKHSLFPVVIIGLTLALGGFIYLTVTSAPEVQTQSSAVVEEITPVNEGDYQEEMQNTLDKFYSAVASAEEDLDVLVAVESAQFSMTNVRVPAQYRDVHLQLALAFTEMQLELKSGERNIEPLLEEMGALVDATDWLQR